MSSKKKITRYSKTKKQQIKNTKPIIIHIEGVQGSGKSYICSKIASSNVKCIDIDDVDLEIKNYIDSLVGTSKEMPRNMDSLGIVWKTKLDDIIEHETKLGKKIIVIVGVKRIYMKDTALDNASYKFFIKLDDLKKIYRRVFIRETDKILENGNKIKEIINNSKIDEDEIGDMVNRITNLALPYPVEYDQYENNYKRELDRATKAKYEIMSQEAIIKKINSLK